MQKRNPHYGYPRTVDEAAELLISDIPVDQRTVLSKMGEQEFMQFYATVAEFIIEDFKLWTGNEALLNSCFDWVDTEDAHYDPAMIILKRVKEKLQDTDGIIIIT